MKFLIISIVVLLSGIVSAQDDLQLVCIYKTNDDPVLYRAIDNHIQLSVSEEDALNYVLTGTYCTISKTDRNGDPLPLNEYIVKTGTGDLATISVIDRKNGNKVVLTREFTIHTLPAPNIYIDGIAAGNKLERDIRLIEVKYDESLALDLRYDITGWTMLINGEVYTGNNYMPTEEVKSIFKSLPSGTKIEMNVSCKSRDEGINFRFKGSFELK